MLIPTAAFVRRGLQSNIQDGSWRVHHAANMETAKSEEDCWSLLTQWPLIVPTVMPMNNCNDCY
jgi:hypothetical protein